MDVDDQAWQEWADGAQPEPKRRSLDGFGIAAVCVAVLTVVGLVALWPGDTPIDTVALEALAVPSEQYAATIESAEVGGCPGAEAVICTNVVFELQDGPDAGERYEQSFPEGGLNPQFELGNTAILARRSPNATVTERTTGPCSFDPSLECVVFGLTVRSGEEESALTFEDLVEVAANVFPGEDALAQFFPGAETEPEVFSLTAPTVQLSYQFSGDFQRRPLLWIVAILFAAVVIALGQLRGVAALAGLAGSLSILLLFVLPAILSGRSPVLVAIVGSAAIAIITLYLAHGFNRMTTVAMLGMVAALGLTAVLSAITVELAQFSGFASEEATLLALFEGIDVSGLLLAGIVLGAAGALDDVTVTQASAVWALKAADVTQSQKLLLSRALRIGRDHIASTVNTLLLAYAGAALPLLVLFVLSEQSLGAIANSEVVAVEIVRTLVGSIGLVASVPLTTWLASLAADAGVQSHAISTALDDV